jgi:hypothetical protein
MTVNACVDGHQSSPTGRLAQWRKMLNGGGYLEQSIPLNSLHTAVTGRDLISFEVPRRT